MKSLSPEEIECLLGMRKSDLHPLEILGYDSSPEDMRRFREERPDFHSQVFSYIQQALKKAGIFPTDIDLADPGVRTFIKDTDSSFTLSSVEETPAGRIERISKPVYCEAGAIYQYIRKVANPDYIHSSGESSLESGVWSEPDPVSNGDAPSDEKKTVPRLAIGRTVLIAVIVLLIFLLFFGKLAGWIG